VNLLPLFLPEDDNDNDDTRGVPKKVLADDRSRAKYIVDTMVEAKKKYSSILKSQRYSSSSSSSSTVSLSDYQTPSKPKSRHDAFSPSEQQSLSSPSISAHKVTFLKDKNQFDSMKKEEQELIYNSRKPKAIVFSQYRNDLQVCFSLFFLFHF
jgi:hypothetical protein